MRIYLTPRVAEDRVLPGEWIAGHGDEPVLDHVPHWEPGQDLTLTSEVRVHRNDLVPDVVAVPEDVVCLSRVDCRATVSRFVTTADAECEGEEVVWRITHVVPGDQVGGALSVQRSLVRRESQSAHAVGSFVWAEAWREIGLAGPGGRWRVVPTSFSGEHLPDVPWRVRINPVEADDLLRSCSEVLVNTDHPAGKEVLDGTSSRSSALVTLLKVDLVEAVIVSCAHLEPSRADDGGDDEEPETVWDTAELMANLYLHQTLPEALAGWEQDPHAFRDRIRADLGYLKDLG